MINIYPSLMAVDPSHVEDEIKLLEQYCAGFHLDVMDNRFVHNSALSIDAVNNIAKMSSKLVWLHLMVEKPDQFYAQIFLPHDSLISFHIESEIDVEQFVKTIREKKHKPSIAISPKTPVSRIVPFLNIVDHILLMSVEPGFSGQPFLPESISRLEELVTHRKKNNNFFKIGIDGGIDIHNIKMIAEKGVDDCAIASGIFKQPDHLVALHELQDAIAR